MINPVTGLSYLKGQRVEDLLLENSSLTKEELEIKLSEMIAEGLVEQYVNGEQTFYIRSDKKVCPV